MAAVTPAAGGVDIAGLQAQAAAASAQLAALTGGTAATGGGVAAATPGAAVAPAAGTVATPAAGAAATVALSGRRADGSTVPVTQTGEKDFNLSTPTGKPEVLMVTIPGVGERKLMFDSRGKETRNYEIADTKNTAVNLSSKVGIASGIANLGNIVAARQERIKELSNALASDTNENKSVNQGDLAKLSQETTATDNIVGLQKKIYDAMQNSIQLWLR